MTNTQLNVKFRGTIAYWTSYVDEWTCRSTSPHGRVDFRVIFAP